MEQMVVHECVHEGRRQAVVAKQVGWDEHRVELVVDRYRKAERRRKAQAQAAQEKAEAMGNQGVQGLI